MFRTTLLCLSACIFPFFLFAQTTRAPGKHLPKPTTKGVGKIDTRIDNMRYWRRMADSGFVFLAPVESIPPAIFTGSDIEFPMVMTVNSPDVPTTSQNSTQSECSVFVNPANNLSLLNSNNSTQNPVGSMYGANSLLSSNGGSTWGGSINGAGGTNYGDPAAAISLSGRQFIGYINTSSSQTVAYSADNGNTWVPVVVASYNGGLLDKNHMWVDNSPVSPFEGNLYSAWTDFGTTNYKQIVIVTSINDGLAWSSPINISSAVNAGSHNQGVNIQTGPDGEVYASWSIYDSWPTDGSDECAIGFAKSIDGGATFTPGTRVISNIRGIRSTETSKNMRVNSFPVMAVDISGGPNNGNIYIVWTNYGTPGINTGPDINIYMIRSTNNGYSWSAPIRVNQDPPGQGKEHYLPWITCDPLTGELSVIFYDDRNVSSTQCEVYVAFSFNAGTTWEDFKVSDVAFTPAPIPGLAGGYMGDYLGISASDSKVYPVWPDNRSGKSMSYVSPFELMTGPIILFEANATTPCLNQTVQFEDMTLKNPTSWLWSISPSDFTFVNSTSATSQNPQVQFNDYGNYSVQLIATNGYGPDTLLKTNYISVNFANADFNVNTNMVFVNNNVIFTDLSHCNISSYSWNFGAGATPATATTPGPHTVSYSSTGFKTVSLTVNGNVTKTKSNFIEVLPVSFNMSNGTLTTCSGVFYDPQGTSNYYNNQDFTMTFMPGDTSKSAQVVFSAFGLEANSSCASDWLKIFDGPSISDSLLGKYCGTNSPGTVVAYKASGALTFQFHSDESVVNQGWTANLSCVNTPPPPPSSYCIANSTNNGEHVSRVQFVNIDKASGCTPGGYVNYTSSVAKVSTGIIYPIIITSGSPYAGDQCGIWIDWNHDYDFSDAGETITVTGSPGVGPYSANIIPPADAVYGITRMRIRVMWGGTLSSCGTANYGEAEDYSVNIGTPGLWVGGTVGYENNWNTPGNWDDGIVPCSATNVVIPESASYYPQGPGTLNCLDMQIKDGAIVVVQPGATLNVSGDMVIGQGNSGILVIDGGTFNLTGQISLNPGSMVDLVNGGMMVDND